MAIARPRRRTISMRSASEAPSLSSVVHCRGRHARLSPTRRPSALLWEISYSCRAYVPASPAVQLSSSFQTSPAARRHTGIHSGAGPTCVSSRRLARTFAFSVSALGEIERVREPQVVGMHQHAVTARLDILRHRQIELRSLVVPRDRPEVALLGVAYARSARVSGPAGARFEIESFGHAEAKARLRAARLAFDVRERHLEARDVDGDGHIEARRHRRHVQHVRPTDSDSRPGPCPSVRS